MALKAPNKPSLLRPIRLPFVRRFVQLTVSVAKEAEMNLTKRRFLESAQDFDAIANFLVRLHIVRISKGVITGGGKEIQTLAALEEGDKRFAEHIATLVVRSKTDYGVEVRAALTQFHLNGGLAVASFGSLRGDLHLARNFLLEFGALRRDHSTKKFHVRDWFFPELVTARFGRGVLPKTLEGKISKQVEIGLQAELQVLEYEHSVVCKKDHPTIVHIATKNVSAGFDIASTRRNQATGELLFRMIEVKAVRKDDWRFTFTRNEVRQAKESKEIYFLYLVPIVSGKPAIAEMKVIQNPVPQLLNSSKWDVQEGDWQVKQIVAR